MRKFRTSVMIIMLGTLISKMLGLVREVILAQKYGTGYISDSFIISLNIPAILITSLAGALLTNYIPIFSKVERESEEKAKKFNGNLLSMCLIISIIVIIIFMFFTKNIARIFAVGFDEIGLTYLVNLSRITIFSLYFIASANIFKGYLEYRGKFVGTSLYGILLNIGMILGILFSSTEKYFLLGYGVLGGYILSFAILVLLARKNNFKAKPNIDFKDECLKKIVILTLPIILNDAVWQINGIVDKSIASTVGAGYISAINYSHYIVDMISSVFATSIVTVFFPNIVKTFNENGIETVKIKTRKILKTIIFITIPVTILIVFFAEIIVKILFYRGAFNKESLDITSTATAIYALALTFVCLKVILFKVFYAIQDTKSPTKSAVIAIVINIILSIVLTKILGYIGIIISTVIASIVSTILLIAMFSKKNGKLIDEKLCKDTGKIFISSLIMAIIIVVVNKLINDIFINNGILIDIVKAIIETLVGIIIYLLSLFLMKFDFEIKKELRNKKDEV